MARFIVWKDNPGGRDKDEVCQFLMEINSGESFLGRNSKTNYMELRENTVLTDH